MRSDEQGPDPQQGSVHWRQGGSSLAWPIGNEEWVFDRQRLGYQSLCAAGIQKLLNCDDQVDNKNERDLHAQSVSRILADFVSLQNVQRIRYTLQFAMHNPKP